MNLISKVYKLFAIYRNFKQRKTQVSALPVRLWIESSFACNLKCVMCPNKDVEAAAKGMMDVGLFKKIIDEAKGFVNDIYLHHRGEPLLNPKLPEMITYAREAGIRTKFHTNGAILDEKRARGLLAAAPDYISISFDGFQKDVYEKVRVGSDFEQTVENIVRFLEMRKSEKKKKPYFVIEEIEFPEYKQQIPAQTRRRLVQRFQKAGLDELIVKHLYHWATEDAPDLSASRNNAVCTFPWYAMVICWDGVVTPCPQDFFAHMALGNVNQKSLREIWNDTPYQELRKKLIHNIDHLDLCRKCDRLCRKQVAGVPFQYMIPFLNDYFIGYGKMRKILGGSFERNEGQLAP